MTITLAGAGCGRDTLTIEAQKAISEAGLLIGSPRLLSELSLPDVPALPLTKASEIAAALRESPAERAVVLLSGDSGFYSGARILLPLLEGEDVRLLPGISSLQFFASRLKMPWQDWRLFSAHGQEVDAVAAVCGDGPAFFLTGPTLSPSALCRQLESAGLASLPVFIGERLGGPDERIHSGCAGSFCDTAFDPLSVMLALPAPRPIRRSGGLPDSLFFRIDKIPMTKQAIRAMILSLLGITPSDVCWDIGAGTGSVGIEMALCSHAVYGVEHKKEALELAARNREALGAYKLRLIEGEAPSILSSLPRPDAVFVGGSGGKLSAILEEVARVNPACRVCVSAIALETCVTAIKTMEGLGWQPSITQVAVSGSRNVGGLHMMTAQNPIYLISGSHQGAPCDPAADFSNFTLA